MPSTRMSAAAGIVVLMCCAHARGQTTAAPGSATQGSPASSAPEQPSPPRDSEALKGVGIFTVVLGGVAFVGSIGIALSEAGSSACFGNFNSVGCPPREKNNSGYYIVGGLLTSVALTAVGVSLIAIGSRPKPHRPPKPHTPGESVKLSPWVGRQSGGLSLRLEL